VQYIAGSFEHEVRCEPLLNRLSTEGLELRAKGYLLKTDVEKELWLAIEAVLQGKQFVSSGLRR
jgi:DNA-binding NarL/FixJ family response regulator